MQNVNCEVQSKASALESDVKWSVQTVKWQWRVSPSMHQDI